MDAKDAEFLKRIMATFRVEAQEHVQNISSGLIELEKTPEPERGAELIELIFRETHSLKGAARSVDQRDIESVCQPMESAFAALKRKEIVLTTALCDLLHRAVDYISHLTGSPEGKPNVQDRARQRELIRQLGEAARANAPSDSAPAPSPPVRTPSEQCPGQPPPTPLEDVKPSLGESVRIPTAKMDPLLLQAEEMILAKMAAAQRVNDMREILQGLAAWRGSDRSGRQPSLPSSAEGEASFLALRHQLETLARSLDLDQRAIRRMVDEHLEAMKGVLMLPVASLVEALPKFVRDLSRDQGKEVDMVIRGGEIEIDKRILEEMKDPIIHLLRNCIDHGIQKPAERQAGHKPPRGTISLSFAALESRQVEVVLSDDGGGIDLERVRTAAVGKGIISTEAASMLETRQTLGLIFQSGVSTSPIITNLSGRGLGLAIVREKVEKMGGVIAVEAHGKEGATFRLVLPMTLATFRGVLVRVDEHLFLLPTVNVQRALRVNLPEIKTVENQQTIALDGEVLSLVKLGRCLGLPERPSPPPRLSAPGAEDAGAGQAPALVLYSADKRMVFQVDEVLEEQQVLLKGLGPQLPRVRNITGAAVLGSGRVAPVLNVADLMASALRPVVGAGGEPAEPATIKSGRILVVEDSITARTLIKSILEAAGYQVSTAVDGVDAFTQLRTGDFDLVVSDVDMPRMNGFELTTKIRGDRKLGELPVVLVTALESREDRERGIDVGANAYVIKSSFDQSNLLGLIHTML